MMDLLWALTVGLLTAVLMGHLGGYGPGVIAAGVVAAQYTWNWLA